MMIMIMITRTTTTAETTINAKVLSSSSAVVVDGIDVSIVDVNITVVDKGSSKTIIITRLQQISQCSSIKRYSLDLFVSLHPKRFPIYKLYFVMKTAQTEEKQQVK